MKIFKITKEQKQQAINSRDLRQIFYLPYDGIEADDSIESVNASCTCISRELMDELFDAPKNLGIDVDEFSWTMEWVNSGPAVEESLVDDDVYWFETYEERKEYFKNENGRNI